MQDLDPIDTLEFSGNGLAQRRHDPVEKPDVKQIESDKNDEQNLAEVEAAYQKQYGKPMSIYNVQLDESRISHENDTEDIATDVDPSNFNPTHSKRWNKEVDKQALAIEN